MQKFNEGRILSLDLARGFTVLFIPIVHAVMLYGKTEVQDSGFGQVLTFIAEWPGAQVFMLLMGVSFEFSSRTSFRSVFVRSVVLLILGYALNFLKFVFPYLAGWLPENFLIDMGADGWVPLLLTGDILQFAGVSLMILWCVQQSPDRPLTALLVGMFVCFASPFPWIGNAHLIELASAGPPRVFFPLFPWLVYPLAGMVIGNALNEYGSKVFVVLVPIGCGLMLSSYCAKLNFVIAPDQSFYTMGPWSTLMHLGFVCVWISTWHLLTVLFDKLRISRNYFFSGLQFMSKRITLIYLVQWPLIFWLIPVIGYKTLGVWPSVVIAIDIMLLTLLIALIIRKPRANRSSGGEEEASS